MWAWKTAAGALCCLVLATGCSVCQHPYAYCGPVWSEGVCTNCNMDYRGGPFSIAVDQAPMPGARFPARILCRAEWKLPIVRFRERFLSHQARRLGPNAVWRQATCGATISPRSCLAPTLSGFRPKVDRKRRTSWILFGLPLGRRAIRSSPMLPCRPIGRQPLRPPKMLRMVRNAKEGGTRKRSVTNRRSADPQEASKEFGWMAHAPAADGHEDQ